MQLARDETDCEEPFREHDRDLLNESSNDEILTLQTAQCGKRAQTMSSELRTAALSKRFGII